MVRFMTISMVRDYNIPEKRKILTRLQRKFDFTETGKDIFKRSRIIFLAI